MIRRFIQYVIRTPADALTEREWEVIIAVCVHELDAHDTAERLVISVKSVWVYLSHIYTKLGVRGVEELRRWYNEQYPSLGLNYRDYLDE